MACFPFGLIGATFGDDLGVTLGDFLATVFFFGCSYYDSSSDSLDSCFLAGFFCAANFGEAFGDVFLAPLVGLTSYSSDSDSESDCFVTFDCFPLAG